MPMLKSTAKAQPPENIANASNFLIINVPSMDAEGTRPAKAENAEESMPGDLASAPPIVVCGGRTSLGHYFAVKAMWVG